MRTKTLPILCITALLALCLALPAAAAPLEAYGMLCEKYGEEAAQARFRRSAYRLLLNIFRTGLFENPYLDLQTSLATVGCPEFVEKGYRSQLRSITMLKNRSRTLPLQTGIKLYVPDRFVKSYLDFMSHPTAAIEPRWIYKRSFSATMRYFNRRRTFYASKIFPFPRGGADLRTVHAFQRLREGQQA